MKLIVTGGAGFIGSAIIWKLNQLGFDDILVVDSLGESIKWKNLVGLKFKDYIEKDDFLTNILNGKYDNLNIDTMIHMGACSSTVGFDNRYYIKNNYEYSKELCKFAVRNGIRFIYASSGATYGDGSNGFEDDENKLEVLRPLNMYGYSKHLFDLWVKNNGLFDKKYRVVGLKYFNVFGPNEYHKGDMRSFVIKAFEQIKKYKKVKLFKSYLEGCPDGEQKRDFIYIKDAVDMTLHFFEKSDLVGIYNIGSGEVHTFNELVETVFDTLGEKVEIEYIDMPEGIKDQYQYFTKAEMKKFFSSGYNKKLRNFRDAIREYVLKYLVDNKYLADYNE